MNILKPGITKPTKRKELEIRQLPHSRVGNQGGLVLEIDNPVEKLLHIVGAGFFNEPRYYDSDKVNKLGLTQNSSEVLDIIENAITYLNDQSTRDASTEDDLFIIARYVREGLNIRTTPAIMLALQAHFGSQAVNKKYLPAYAPYILSRADDSIQAFAFYRHYFQHVPSAKSQIHKGSLPHALRRGLVHALQHQRLALIIKHNSNVTRPNMKDILVMLRQTKYNKRNALPKEAYEYIVNETVPDETNTSDVAVFIRKHASYYNQKLLTPEALQRAKELGLTWENIVTHFGSTKEVWEALVERNMLNFMALIRNLRNLESVQIDDTYWTKIYTRITTMDPAKHKQLPFRFIASYNAVTNTIAKNALSIALDRSIANMPMLPGRTCIMIDNSGSMSAPLSRKSTMKCVDAGNTLGALIAKISLDNIVGTFGNLWGRIDYTVNDSVISIKGKLDAMGLKTGHATDITPAMNYLLKKKQKVARIIIISDMNIYNAYPFATKNYESPAVLIQKYQQKVNPETFVFSINIAGAKDAQVDPENPRVHLLSGWSEKLVDLVLQLEGKLKTPTPKTTQESVDSVPTMEVLRKRYKLEVS